MTEWKKHKIGDFLTRIRRPIKLELVKEYKLVTIKMHHKGIVQRCTKKGSEIKSNMNTVHTGDFILSGIDARNGAFGIIPSELDGAIVTNDFWFFEVDESVINKQLFLELTQTSWFDEICKKGSSGVTRRIRLQKDKFFNQEILLPLKEDQKILLNRISTIKKERMELSTEITRQKELLKKLRQSILQEAIHGKLTTEWREQNPNVEPASELLEKIKTGKEKLIKEKKIKKTPAGRQAGKLLPPIKPEEILFEIPKIWQWCRLGNAGLFERGKSKHRPRNEESLFTNGTYPFVQTGDVARSKSSNFRIETFSKSYNEKGLCQSRLWPKNTLCITIAANIAETGFLDFDACFPDSVVGFTSFLDNITSFYVRYFIDVSKKDIEKFAPATAQKNINLGIIDSLAFPFPPLSEQKEIVSRVEKLMSYCDELEEQISKTEKYSEQIMQTVLKEAFER